MYQPVRNVISCCRKTGRRIITQVFPEQQSEYIFYLQSDRVISIRTLFAYLWLI